MKKLMTSVRRKAGTKNICRGDRVKKEFPKIKNIFCRALANLFGLFVPTVSLISLLQELGPFSTYCCHLAAPQLVTNKKHTPIYSVLLSVFHNAAFKYFFLFF